MDMFVKLRKMSYINYKILTKLICVIGFAYHTISLTMEYLSGNTVVNIMIGPLFKEGLPAITICPGYMAIDKVANLSEDLLNLYQDYSNYIDMDMNNLNNSISYNFEIINTHNAARNIIKTMMKNGEMNMGDMFNKFTYNYDYEMPSFEFYIHETSIIEGELEQLINHSNIITMDDGKDYYWIKVNPIESMILDFTAFKCYTFFSYIDSVWQNVKIDFKRIKILPKFDVMSYPYFLLPVPIFIHSPNDLPLLDYGKLLPLESEVSQLIQYSTIKILRLGRDYETDCREYGNEYEYDTRSSCIVSCVKHHHDTICDNSSLPQLENLVTNKFITINYNKSITECTAYYKIKQDILAHCSKQCHFNCHYKYYSANIQRLNDLEHFKSDLMMEHNQMPDILIKYIPETSLISFACNFGGLLGMWLGLSFLSIIEDSIDSIFKLKLPKTTINISNRINLIDPHQNNVVTPRNQNFFQYTNVSLNSK